MNTWTSITDELPPDPPEGDKHNYVVKNRDKNTLWITDVNPSEWNKSDSIFPTKITHWLKMSEILK